MQVRWWSVQLMVLACGALGCLGDGHDQEPLDGESHESSALSSGRGAANGRGGERDGDFARERAGRAIRLIAPVSGSIALGRRPELRWSAPHVRQVVQICADRPCREVIAELHGDEAARPPRPLPPGVVFWRVLAGPGRRLASETWELRIPANESSAVGVWGALPDFNGDGYADIALGAVPPGQVWVYFGGPSGPGSTPDQVLSTWEADLGLSLAPAGDVNGDGFVDLAVASDAPDGRVALYEGGRRGLSRDRVLRSGPVEAGFGFVSFESAIGGVRPMSTAGDVNRDGYADLWVGGQEAAQLFYGGRAGIRPRAGFTLLASPIFLTDSVAGGADFNDDGLPDAVIYFPHLNTGSGFVAAPVSTTITGGEMIGDFDGDGIADFASYQVWRGSPSGLQPSISFAGQSLFGAAGDVNGDGKMDAIASLGPMNQVPERHRVYFGTTAECGISPPPPDCQPFAPILVPGHTWEEPSSSFPLVVGVGDVDRDGFDDLVATTPDTGEIYLFRGSATGPVPPSGPMASGAAGIGISVAGL